MNKRDDGTIEITFEGTLLEQGTDHRFLGLGFTEDLSWNTHVNKLEAGLSRVTGSIYSVQNLPPTWLQRTLY